MNVKFYLFVLLLITSNLVVMSQTVRKYLISGVVLDSVSNPVDYSTVILSTLMAEALITRLQINRAVFVWKTPRRAGTI